jgi:type IV secretion system protein VirB6
MNMGITFGNSMGSGRILSAFDPTNIGDFVFYKLVSDFLNQKIIEFTEQFLFRMMTWAGLMALTLVTLWILITGYRIITGRMRESLMHVVTDMAKVVLIISIATTASVFGTNLQTLLTQDMNKAVNGVVTGDSNQTIADVIDKNLAYTQLALGAIDAVQVTQGDDATQGDKARALLMAGFGTASPPMAAGAMLMLYTFVIALLVGIAPLFILFLLFEQTKGMFQRWLLYIIGTTFSMAVLSVVSSMCLDVSLRAAGALWGAKITNSILGNGPEGLSSQALQQGGVGLLMTVLIVSVPPIMGQIFQNTLGNFMHFSAFGGGFSSKPGPQGQPPGSYQPPQTGGPQTANTKQMSNSNELGLRHGSHISGSPSSLQSDTIKKSDT